MLSSSRDVQWASWVTNTLLLPQDRSQLMIFETFTHPGLSWLLIHIFTCGVINNTDNDYFTLVFWRITCRVSHRCFKLSFNVLPQYCNIISAHKESITHLRKPHFVIVHWLHNDINKLFVVAKNCLTGDTCIIITSYTYESKLRSIFWMSILAGFTRNIQEKLGLQILVMIDLKH